MIDSFDGFYNVYLPLYTFVYYLGTLFLFCYWNQVFFSSTYIDGAIKCVCVCFFESFLSLFIILILLIHDTHSDSRVISNYSYILIFSFNGMQARIYDFCEIYKNFRRNSRSVKRSFSIRTHRVIFVRLIIASNIAK